MHMFQTISSQLVGLFGSTTLSQGWSKIKCISDIYTIIHNSYKISYEIAIKSFYGWESP